MAGMIQMLGQLLAAQKTDYRPEEPDIPHVTQVRVHSGKALFLATFVFA